MRIKLKQQRLLDFLARSGLSQNHWAIKLGLSRGHWSEIVNGKHPYPSPRTRERMIEVLGVPFEELFEIESGAEGWSDATFQAAIADRYVIDKEIGQGGMGTVYLARDVKLGRQVAIKVVSPEIVSGIGVKQFLKEIRYTARLQHHHILPLYDGGEAAGYPYYVTPYISGGSLRELLRREKTLSPQTTLRIAQGIAEALDHAHRHHILHCDVKPENVLLSGTHAFVADFGISRAVHAEVFEWGRTRRAQIDSSAGTPAYVSPEQASGEENLDARSDVYSFGCMVFEMLGGRPPFTGTTTMETVARRFTSAPPVLSELVPEVSWAVGRVVAQAMELPPERRFTSVVEFASALGEAVVHRPRSFGARVSAGIRTVRGVGRIAGRILRPGGLMESLWQDVRYTLRTLARKPAFAAVVIMTLALGIGANTAIFSVIDGVILRPLPYPEPDRLVRISSTYRGDRSGSLSAPNFVDLRENVRQFEVVAASSYGGSFNLSTGAEPVRVSGMQVTDGFFRVLGVAPQHGRFFRPEDDVAGAERVVVLSDALWRERFDANPEVIGQALTLDAEPHTIIGVTGPEFRFGNFFGGETALWVPYAWNPDSMPQRGSHFLLVMGRLKPGVSLPSSVAELETIFTSLREQYPRANQFRSATAFPLHEYFVGRSSRQQLLVLGGAVGLVLLVACVNVANLMLARAETRQRELAVRAAMGAGRTRLARQFLTESVVLAGLGGIVGVAGAYWGVQALMALFGSAVPRSGEVALNPTALSFTLLISILTGVLVGVIPAWQARPDALYEGLKEGGRGAVRGGTRIRQSLVVLETALALVLVVGAGLLLKSFWRMQQMDLGVDQHNLLAIHLDLPSTRYESADVVNQFYDRAVARIRELPQVVDVATANKVPFTRGNSNFTKVIPAGNPDIQANWVETRYVSPGYFKTVGTPILRGRDFTLQDSPDAPQVIVINQELAERLFPGDDPIGKRINPGWIEEGVPVVGVVANVREWGPDDRIPTAIYWHHPQSGTFNSQYLVIRTTSRPTDIVPTVRRIVHEMDADIPLYDVAAVSQMVTESIGGHRFALWLLAIFGGLALALGAVGIYGVMSYTVEQRTREVGLRLALGARPRDVLRLVIRQGATLAMIGIALGAGAAFALRKVVASMLVEVSAFDPTTYIVVAGLLTLTAVLACYVPAARAATVDPMEALRYE